MSDERISGEAAPAGVGNAAGAPGASGLSGSEPPVAERGFWDAFLDLFVAPSEGFAALLPKARFWQPLLLLLTLNLAFMAYWAPRADVRGMMQATLEEQGLWDRLTADQRTDILDRQVAIFPIASWVGAIAGAPIVVLMLGGLFLFVYRFFYASDVTFPQSLTVVAAAFAALGCLHSPAIALTLALKGDWTLNPQYAVQSSLASLVDKTDVAPALFTLLGWFDAFLLWSMFLLATGFAVASKRSTLSAAWGVAIPWAMLVAGSVLFRLMMG